MSPRLSVLEELTRLCRLKHSFETDKRDACFESVDDAMVRPFILFNLTTLLEIGDGLG